MTIISVFTDNPRDRQEQTDIGMIARRRDACLSLLDYVRANPGCGIKAATDHCKFSARMNQCSWREKRQMVRRLLAALETVALVKQTGDNKWEPVQ
jgi:hypothetical protein